MLTLCLMISDTMGFILKIAIIFVTFYIPGNAKEMATVTKKVYFDIAIGGDKVCTSFTSFY